MPRPNPASGTAQAFGCRVDIPDVPNSVSSELSVVCEAPGIFCGYLWKNVNILVWTNTATLESMSVYDAGAKRLRKLTPNGASAVHIMLGGLTRMPTAETRDALYRVNNECGEFMKTAAVVIQSDGFFASAMRSLLTALNRHGVSIRGLTNLKFCTIEGVGEWLPEPHEKATGVAIDGAELVAAMNAAVSRHASDR